MLLQGVFEGERRAAASWRTTAKSRQPLVSSIFRVDVGPTLAYAGPTTCRCPQRPRMVAPMLGSRRSCATAVVPSLPRRRGSACLRRCQDAPLLRICDTASSGEVGTGRERERDSVGRGGGGRCRAAVSHPEISNFRM
jgi:hypothetical protein